MKSESDNMGKRLYVTGNINSLAKYLNMDEYKILSIFDFDALCFAVNDRLVVSI